MGKKKPNFYAVRAGRSPGIYLSWAECELQVKGFASASFKGFSTRAEAEDFITGRPTSFPLQAEASSAQQSTGVAGSGVPNQNNSPHQCGSGCGRAAFRSYSTCCWHCTGTDGPHAGDCAMKHSAAANSDVQLVSSISPAAALELHNARVPVVDLVDSPIKERVVAPTVKREPCSNVRASVMQSRALTEQQKARIEKQKQEALQRRELRQQQNAREQCVTPARSAAVGAAFESSATLRKQPKTVATGAAQMNAEQQRVVELVKRNKNVFFTGAAGTGKSFTTAQMISYLKSVYRDKFTRRVAVVGPTGIAASHINGVTINSSSGVGVPLLVKDFGRMHAKTFPIYDHKTGQTVEKKVWAELLHLIVDEVSMLSGEFLDRFDEQVREIRWYYGVAPNGQKYRTLYSSWEEMPFLGGIQLVVCGDMFQLPPIQKSFDPATYQLFNASKLPELLIKQNSKDEQGFANRGLPWESRSWWSAQFESVELVQTYRQRDPQFIAILNRIRTAQQTQADLDALNTQCTRNLPATNGIVPLSLVAVNKQADERNQIGLDALDGPTVAFLAKDSVQLFTKGEFDHGHCGSTLERAMQEGCTLWKDCLAKGEVVLKAGAQVILLVNVDQREPCSAHACSHSNCCHDGRWCGDAAHTPSLVNGSLGKILRWATASEILTQLRGRVDEQLIQAGAIWQQLNVWDPTTDADQLLREASRVLHLVEALIERSCSQPRARDDVTSVAESSKCRNLHCLLWVLRRWGNEEVPFVQFLNGRQEAVIATVFSEELLGFGVARRLQMPLKAAWALSIHKSQGMGLEAVKLDCSRVWENGQLYVGLSRVKSLAGLQLEMPLKSNQIKCSKKAEEFMDHVRAGSSTRFEIWSDHYPAKTKSSLQLPGEGPLSQPGQRPQGHPECLMDEKVVFTGENEMLQRSEWEEVINNHGGQVCKQVSGKTTMLVVCRGNNGLNVTGQPVESGKKYAEASRHNTKTVSESELWEMIQNAPNKRRKLESYWMEHD